MEDLFLEAKTADGRTICISPLSRRTYRECKARGLGGDEGYFLYEYDENRPHEGMEILGKVASIDAAMKLFEVLAVACGHNLRKFETKEV